MSHPARHQNPRADPNYALFPLFQGSNGLLLAGVSQWTRCAQPHRHFQKEQVPGLDSPKHSTPGSPQKSSWHSRQVRPPKPGMQWHCPVNCQSQKANPSGGVSPSAAHPCTRQGPSLGHAPALPHLVAGRAEGARGVAVALLAAGAAGQPPRVGGTAVAGLPHHVREAPALPCGRLAAAALRALAVLPDSAQVVADALCEGKSAAPPRQPAPATRLPWLLVYSLSPQRCGLMLARPSASGQAWLTQHWMTPSTAQEPSSCPAAGHLYSFCPSTQKATGVPHSTSPTLPALLHSSLCTTKAQVCPALLSQLWWQICLKWWPGQQQAHLLSDPPVLLGCAWCHRRGGSASPPPFQLPITAFILTAQLHVGSVATCKQKPNPPPTTLSLGKSCKILPPFSKCKCCLPPPSQMGARSPAQLQGNCRQLQLEIIRFFLHSKCSQVKST